MSKMEWNKWSSKPSDFKFRDFMQSPMQNNNYQNFQMDSRDLFTFNVW